MEKKRSKDDNLYELPSALPVPLDDGACDHLLNFRLPSSLCLPSTNPEEPNVFVGQRKRKVVIYCYPRTGTPTNPPPVPHWNQIPGARGCTPQSCSFRDHYAQFRELGVECFGLSTQTTAYQDEARQRLHLPFHLLSDSDLAFVTALRLPTFSVESEEVKEPLIKRLTMVINEERVVEKVFYPVFPPDKDAETVLAWLKSNA